MKKILLPMLAAALAFACAKENTPIGSGDPSPHEGACVEQAFSTPPDEILRLPGGTVARYGDTYVLGGDIILTERQMEILSQPETRGAIVANLVEKWPWNVVYYEYDSSLPWYYYEQRSPGQDPYIPKAFREFESKTNLRFVPRTYQRNYVTFISGSGGSASSNIGMAGGQQFIRLTTSTYGTVVHEIGHAVGLFHEHQRPDRDNYITVDPLYQYWDEYEKLSRSLVEPVGPFDFESVMLYGSYRNFDKIMWKKGEPDNTWARQRDGLSAGDVAALNILYPKRVGLDLESTFAEYSPESGSRVYDNYVIIDGNPDGQLIRFKIELELTFDDRGEVPGDVEVPAYDIDDPYPGQVVISWEEYQTTSSRVLLPQTFRSVRGARSEYGDIIQL